MEVCTPRQQDRGLYVVEKIEGAKHQRHITTSPLDFYYHRSLIKQHHWDAGNMLLKHAVRANMTPGVKSASMAPTARDGTNQTESTVASQMDASKRAHAALEAISGRRQRKAVEFVCIEGRFISHLKKETTYKTIQFEHFLEGIEYVAKHFGLI